MHCKGLFCTTYHQGTLRRMSPQLRAEIANGENAQWVLKVRPFASPHRRRAGGVRGGGALVFPCRRRGADEACLTTRSTDRPSSHWT